MICDKGGHTLGYSAKPKAGVSRHHPLPDCRQVGIVPRVALRVRLARQRGSPSRAAQPEPLCTPAAAAAARLRRYVTTLQL